MGLDNGDTTHRYIHRMTPSPMTCPEVPLVAGVGSSAGSTHGMASRKSMGLMPPVTRTQLGKVSRPSEAACCLALSLKFSILVVLLLRLGRAPEVCSMGEDQTCWA